MHICKNKLLVLVLCLNFCLYASVSLAAQGETDKNTAAPEKELSLQEAQEEMQNALREIISASGKVLTGMAAGMQEGAQDIQIQLDSLDGTKLIANKKDLAELLQVNVFKLEEQGNGAWRVTLALKNTNAFPVRLTNLTNRQSVLLLDDAGFAYSPVPSPDLSRTLTVPARAAIKATFDFSGLDEVKPGLFRLFDTDIPLKATAI